MFKRVLACASAAAGLMLTVAACSGAHAPAAKSTPSAAQAVPSMPVFPPQFTGTKLSSALLPSADLPGFSVVPAATYNTGSGVGYDESYYLDQMSCADYAKNFGNPGFGETALARNELENGSGQFFEQGIMQFTASAGALDYLAHTEQLVGRCPSFNASLQEGATHFRMQVSTAPPVSGHQAILTKVVLPAPMRSRMSSLSPTAPTSVSSSPWASARRRRRARRCAPWPPSWYRTLRRCTDGDRGGKGAVARSSGPGSSNRRD